MEVEVNGFGVLLAALSSMVIGALYYSDAFYGKQWRKLSQVDPKWLQKESSKALPWVFLASVLTAYILAHVMYLSHEFYDYSWLSTGVSTALWLWLGISATTLYVHNVMENRPRRLTWLNIGNRLLTLLAMGLILGWLHP